MARKVEPLKKAVADIAFRGFRDGVTLAGAVEYKLIMDDPTELQIQVRDGMNRGPRYFLIKVIEPTS